MSACPGRTAAQGGRYLFVGPGYDGPLPDGGFFVSHARTNRMTLIGRAFMVDNDPTAGARGDPQRVSGSHPYVPGAQRHRRRAFLAGRRRSARRRPRPRPDSSTASGMSFNTITPNDFSLLGTRQRAGPARSPPDAGDPETPRACSPRSGSSRASRSSPTRGCAGSSRRRSWSATPPARTRDVRARDPRKASPSTRTRSGRARCSSVATSSWTRHR